MYYTQEQVDRANQADLVSFLQSQGEQLTRAGQEYRWKRHDSLTVRGNKWYRHSQSKGGAAPSGRNRSDKEKDGQATLPVRPKCFPIKWTLLIPNIKTNLLFRP